MDNWFRYYRQPKLSIIEIASILQRQYNWMKVLGIIEKEQNKNYVDDGYTVKRTCVGFLNKKNLEEHGFTIQIIDDKKYIIGIDPVE
jgi:hypothetical protein